MKSFTFQCKTPFFRVMSFLTLSLPLVLLMGLFSGQALAVCPDSGFEDDDGDLEFNEECIEIVPGTNDPFTSDLDWNTFASSAPVSWTGSTPDRVGTATESGWTFAGVEDAQVSSSDIGFVGGTKQDDNCAAVTLGKALNKGDLKRIYLSTNTVDGDVFLNLAWVRIPQNSTSASAHVAFEFNQGVVACPEGSDGLVHRTADDMLVVYDFEGGTADPIIKLARWTTDPLDACDVAKNSPPCWGVARELTSGEAEAAVNVGMSVPDAIGPDGSETLGLVEFGEAGINLTAAGVFTDGECESFGSAFAVSRSSGNSGTAQMKDLVGPVDFTLANCGTVIVRKETVPGDATTEFDFSTTVTTDNGNPVAAFTLMDGDDNTIEKVDAGIGLTVTEADPSGAGYKLTGIDCSSGTGTVTPTATSIATGTVTFDIAAGETLDCTFTNTLQTGDITVTKQVVNACTGVDINGDSLDGGQFTLFIGDDKKTGGDGTVHKVDDLAPGDYLVGENDPGAEYLSSIDGDDGCSDGSVSLGADESVSCTVTNTRLSHIKINKVVTDGSSATFDLLIDGVVYKEGVAGWFAGDGDNAGDGDSVEAIVSNGAHTIKELQNDGVTEVDTTQWLVNITCTDGSSGQGVELGVTTDSGELIECTIYNIPVLSAPVCVEPNALP